MLHSALLRNILMNIFLLSVCNSYFFNENAAFFKSFSEKNKVSLDIRVVNISILRFLDRENQVRKLFVPKKVDQMHYSKKSRSFFITNQLQRDKIYISL